MEKIAKFNAEDPFLLSEQLTEEERMIADSARAYARENLLPRVTDMFINESDAPEIFTEMGAQGLLGVTIKLNGDTQQTLRAHLGKDFRRIGFVDEHIGDAR